MKEERILWVLGEAEELYIAEAAPAEGRKPVLRKLLITAACFALLLALTAAAYAANWFGLRDLLLPRLGETAQSVGQDERWIGLTGYQGSPEWKALAEWQAFLQAYDPDGKLYQNTQGQLDSSFARYSCYQVYTPETADKMDEIAESHGLQLHTTAFDLQAQPELTEVLGDFAHGGRLYYTYMYEDGTFQAEGTILFEDIGAWDYTLLRSVRGTFHDAMLDIGTITDYEETAYEAACGTSVTLALGKSQALILADLTDSFVTIHIPFGTDSGIGEEHLETLADSINFAALTPVTPPPVGDPASPIETDRATRTVYAATLRNLLYSGILPDGSQGEMGSAWSQFAVADVDRDGKEELVLLYDPGIMADCLGYIIGYDGENIRIQLVEFPFFAFLENGYLKALSSHNQTGEEIWPYTLYQYLSESDSYRPMEYVDETDEIHDAPDAYPAEKELKIDYLTLTEENIRSLE